MFIAIAGGSPLAANLVKLLKGSGHKIAIVLANKDIAMQLGSETGAIAVCGNPADPEILDELELEKADIFIAACGSEEQSVMAALYAKEEGAKRIFVETSSPSTEKILRKEGISPLNAELHAAKMLELMIARPAVARLVEVGEGGADIIEIPCRGTKLIGKTLKDVSGMGFFPAGAYFEGKISLDPSLKFGADSTLLLVCKNGEQEKVRRALR